MNARVQTLVAMAALLALGCPKIADEVERVTSAENAAATRFDEPRGSADCSEGLGPGRSLRTEEPISAFRFTRSQVRHLEGSLAWVDLGLEDKGPLTLVRVDLKGKSLLRRTLRTEGGLRRSGLVSATDGARLVVASTLFTGRDEANIEVLMLEPTGEIVWQTTLGTKDTYENHPGVAIVGTSVICVWSEGSFPYERIIRSAQLDVETGKEIYRHTVAELPSPGGMLRPGLVGLDGAATAVWSVAAPDERQRGLFAARLDATGAPTRTVKLATEAGVEDIALAATATTTLVLSTGGMARGSPVRATVLDGGLEVVAKLSFPAAPGSLKLRAARNGEGFAVAWSSGELGAPHETWLSGIDATGGASPPRSVTGGLGGMASALVDVGERALLIHTSKAHQDATLLTDVVCGTYDGPVDQDPCVLRKTHVSLPHRERSKWAVARSASGDWLLVRGSADGAVSFRTAHGTSVLGEARSLPGVVIAHHPRLVPSGRGFVLVWRDFDQNVLLARLDGSGSLDGTPTVVSEGAQLDFGGPCVLAGAQSMVAWAGEPIGKIHIATVDSKGRVVGRQQIDGHEGPLLCDFLPSSSPPQLFVVDPTSRRAPARLVTVGGTTRRIEGHWASVGAIGATPSSLHGWGVTRVETVPTSGLYVRWIARSGEVDRGGFLLQSPPNGPGFVAYGTSVVDSAARVYAIASDGLYSRKICPELLERRPNR